MLDKNYKVEKGFLADIPGRFRQGANEMLMIEPLFNMLAWSKPGLLERYFKEKIPEGDEKKLVQSRLVLAKITYFHPQSLSVDSLKALLKLAGNFMELGYLEPEKLAQTTAQQYPVFANWVMAADKIVKQPKQTAMPKIKDTPEVDVDWCR